MTTAHASLTGAELHEPKGVAAASAKTVYVANGSGSGSWTTLDYATLPNGTVLQHQYTAVETRTSTTSVIPTDGTIPQNTEGTEVMTVSITPKLSTSILKIEFTLAVSGSDNTSIIGALFKDSDASAIYACVSFSAAGGTVYWANQSLHGCFYVTSGSTSSRTYKVRLGNGRSTGYNAVLNENLFGNVELSTLSVTEIKA